jgi:hypothetical protein
MDDCGEEAFIRIYRVPRIVDAPQRLASPETGRASEAAPASANHRVDVKTIQMSPKLETRVLKAQALQKRKEMPRRDVHSWTPIDLLRVAAEPPERPRIAGIAYPGRRHLYSGETESLKSLVAMIVCVEEIRAGNCAMYIDCEMGEREALERFRALGLADEEISDRLIYVHPSEPMTSADVLADVIVLIETRLPTVVVADAVTGMLALHDLDPNSSVDVEKFYLGIVDPLRKYGAAVISLDHVTKNKETQGRYAIGSERKVAGADVHLRFETVRPFGRGRNGLVKLTVAKDRPGWLPRPKAAEIEFHSDADTGRITYDIRLNEHGQDKQAAEFRPTALMERISRYVEPAATQPSRTEIINNVSGATEYKRMAIDILVSEGYLAEETGARGARLVSSIRRYREADEPSPPDPASPRLDSALGAVKTNPPPRLPLTAGGAGSTGGQAAIPTATPPCYGRSVDLVTPPEPEDSR